MRRRFRVLYAAAWERGDRRDHVALRSPRQRPSQHRDGDDEAYGRASVRQDDAGVPPERAVDDSDRVARLQSRSGENGHSGQLQGFGAAASSRFRSCWSRTSRTRTIKRLRIAPRRSAGLAPEEHVARKQRRVGDEGTVRPALRAGFGGDVERHTARKEIPRELLFLPASGVRDPPGSLPPGNAKMSLGKDLRPAFQERHVRGTPLLAPPLQGSGQVVCFRKRHRTTPRGSGWPKTWSTGQVSRLAVDRGNRALQLRKRLIGRRGCPARGSPGRGRTGLPHPVRTDRVCRPGALGRGTARLCAPGETRLEPIHPPFQP